MPQKQAMDNRKNSPNIQTTDNASLNFPPLPSVCTSLTLTTSTSTTTTASLRLPVPSTQETAQLDQHAQRNEERVSWAYKLDKGQLQEELRNRNLDPSGSVEVLRKRLVTSLRTPVGTPNEELLPDTPENTTITKRDEVLENLREIVGLEPTADLRALRERLTSLMRLAREVETLPPTLTEKPNTHPPGDANHEEAQHIRPRNVQADFPPRVSEENEASTKPIHGRYFDVASLCDAVRKWNLKFDDRMDPVAFIERLHELIDAYEIPANQILKALSEIFKGNALLWWRNSRDSWRNFDDFTRDFELQYLPPGYYRNLEKEIQSRTQGEREPCRAFVVALSTLIRRRGGYTEETRLERIYSNLKPGYKLFIRRNELRSVADLIARAEEYEGILREKSTYRPPPASTLTFTPEAAYQQRSPKRVNFGDKVYLEEIGPWELDKICTAPESKTQHSRFPPKSMERETNPPGKFIRGASEGPMSERRSRSPSVITDPPQARSRSTSPNPQTRFVCWNCDQQGHLARKCPLPRRIRCHFCKKEGQLTVNCRCRSGNEYSTLRKGSLQSRAD